MLKKRYESLLEEQQREIEALTEKANIFDEIRQKEYSEAKRSLGRLWSDEMTGLSIPSLSKLVKNYGRH